MLNSNSIVANHSTHNSKTEALNFAAATGREESTTKCINL